MITWYQVPTQNSVSNTLWIIVALKGMTNRSSKHRKIRIQEISWNM